MLKRFSELKQRGPVVHGGGSIGLKVYLGQKLVIDSRNVARGTSILSLLPEDLAARSCVALVSDGKTAHCLHAPVLHDGCSFQLIEVPIDSNSSEEDVDLAGGLFEKDTGHPANLALWHSAAHLLGAALVDRWPGRVQLTDGPPLRDHGGGFFYEFFLAPGKKSGAGGDDGRDVVTEQGDFAPLLKTMTRLARANHPFERVDMTVDDARLLFADNPFKLAIIDQVATRSQVVEPGTPCLSAYRCGPFVDLCRGPHIPSTGLIKAMALTHVSGSHDHQQSRLSPAQHQSQEEEEEHSDREQSGTVSVSSSAVGTSVAGPESRQGAFLQRVYGIAFGRKSQLKTWQERRAIALSRDHRKLGRDQQLWSFHPESPGAPFLLPHGARLFHRLQSMLRQEYLRFGFEEVRTPLMFHRSLWERSGHWEVYKSNMFAVTDASSSSSSSPSSSSSSSSISSSSSSYSSSCPNCCGSSGKTEDSSHPSFSLKPMNCPGHCLLFGERVRSHRELPVRWADFSPIHRNELAGALTGLTRVRMFHQDDGHVFCTAGQVGHEIGQCLQFLERVYERLGFRQFQYTLSTRPLDAAERIGDNALWDRAEQALRNALAGATGEACVDVDDVVGESDPVVRRQFVEAAGEGAFYGPKIDVMVRDALDRSHQLGTVQLDFQLPERFQLEYVGADGDRHRPVLIHRAIMGSMERALAVLAESCGGAWPVWLSPRQVAVLPVSPERHGQFARKLTDRLRIDHGLHAEMFAAAEPLRRRLRDAAGLRFNYVITVGDQEVESGNLAVRKRASISPSQQNSPTQQQQSMSIDQFILQITNEMKNFE